MTDKDGFVRRIFLAVSSIDRLLHTHTDRKLRVVGETNENLTAKYRIVKNG